MEKIILVGAGGHAKTIVDTIERMGTYEIAGFLAPGFVGESVYRGYTIIGNDEDMDSIFCSGVWNAVLAIGYLGNSDLRESLFYKLKQRGFYLPVIVDDTALVASDARLGEGSYIGRRAVINADVEIGKGCIINTGSIIEHESRVGDFSHVAVSAVVCGQCKIGQGAFIGSNATILQGLEVGKGGIIGAGAVVIRDVLEDGKVVGVPARDLEV